MSPFGSSALVYVTIAEKVTWHAAATAAPEALGRGHTAKEGARTFFQNMQLGTSMKKPYVLFPFIYLKILEVAS